MDYKEKLEEAKRLYETANVDQRYVLEGLFPELKESEDEKTKKEIINYLECQSRDEPSRKDTHNKWISYIEKYALSKDNYGFLRDCARVLKTFGWQSYADRLTGLCPASGEAAKAMMSTPIIYDESEDERIRKELIFYFQEEIPQCSIQEHADKMKEFIAWLEKQGKQKYIPKYKIGDYVKNTNYKGEPIYEIVYMDKECYICEYRGKERMGDKAVMHFSFDNPYLRLVQKPTWSEEDEKMFSQISDILWEGYKNSTGEKIPTWDNIREWCLSLKDRVQPQPKHKWSEEDERILFKIQDHLREFYVEKKGYPYVAEPDSPEMMEFNWLKSLRPQNRWKPSEAQVRVVARLRHCLLEDVRGDDIMILDELLEQLKAL